MSTTLTAPADATLLRHDDRPAATWLEALPLGNGSTGAMVFGDLDVVLRHGDLRVPLTLRAGAAQRLDGGLRPPDAEG